MNTTSQCVECGKWFFPEPRPNAAARPHCGLLTPDGPTCYPCLDVIASKHEASDESK